MEIENMENPWAGSWWEFGVTRMRLLGESAGRTSFMFEIWIAFSFAGLHHHSHLEITRTDHSVAGRVVGLPALPT